MNRPLLLLCVAAWLSVVAWAAVIFYVSTLTGQQVEQVLPMKIWDKALHFGIFAAGGLLLAAALRFTTGWKWRAIVPAAVVLASLYGASDEYHQLSTPGRSGADIGDWTADTLGAVAGSMVTGAISRARGRHITSRTHLPS